MVAARMFSASSDYHSLHDTITYKPAHPVTFSDDKITVFDNYSVKERRFVPWELKETTFKNGMGFAGTIVVDHFLHLGFVTNFALGAWCVQWAINVQRMLFKSVN